MDRIEANVENTKDFVATAVADTKKAMQYQKSAAKVSCEPLSDSFP